MVLLLVRCGVYLEGEYGVNNLFVRVPVKLGKNGVEQIIVISLTTEERAALQKSAGAVQELIDASRYLIFKYILTSKKESLRAFLFFRSI